MPCREIMEIIHKVQASGGTLRDVHTKIVANGWSDLEADEIVDCLKRQQEQGILSVDAPRFAKNQMEGAFRKLAWLKFFALIGVIAIFLIISFFIYLLHLSISN